MKITNYGIVKDKMAEYEKLDKLLKDLDGQISIIITDNGFKIMTVGAWPTCDHTLSNLAIDFIETARKIYIDRLKRLSEDIELL